MDEIKAVVYDETSVTSPKNWNNPRFGDPCYSLHTDSRNYVVIALEGHEYGRQAHGVCYGLSRSFLKGGMNAGGMPVEEQIQPSITAQGTGAVCYEIKREDVVVIVNSSGNGIATAIDASYYKGQGLRQGKEREFVMIYEDLSCDNRGIVR